MKKITIAVALGLSLFLVGGAAWAGAVLHLGDPPNAGTYLYNGHVLPVGDSYVEILENGTGSAELSEEFLLIIGVPNDAGFTAPDADWENFDTATSGGPVSPSFEGTLTAGEEVYSDLGLSATSNNSNSFTNWAAADLAVHNITVSAFYLWVYDLGGDGALISGGETVGVTFDGSLPTGTFLVAYGVDDKERNFSTPFTESALVPEPGTVLLLGSGLLGLVLYRRKFQA